MGKIKYEFEMRAIDFTPRQQSRLKEIVVYTWLKNILGQNIFENENGAQAVARWAMSLAPEHTGLENTLFTDAVEFIRNTSFEERRPDLDETILGMASIGGHVRYLMRLTGKGHPTINVSIKHGILSPPCLVQWDENNSNIFVDLAYQHIMGVLESNFVKL